MFYDINVKPGTWIRELVTKRVTYVGCELAKKELKYDMHEVIAFYKTKLYRHRKFVEIKKLIYIKIIIPLSHMIETWILKINIFIYSIDWTYQLNIPYLFCRFV